MNADRKALGQTDTEGRYGTEAADWVIQRAAACAKNYANLIDPIRKVARQFGYAVGVHGTLARDIDLIAVPWTDSAVDPQLLVDAIAGLVRAFNDGFVKVDDDCPRDKPHGRRCWSIHGHGGFYVDLSVMPRTTS